MKPNLLLQSLWIISPLLLMTSPAEAQSIPACRDITPSPGLVCYTEHSFSGRQRDEDGTKHWSFIVERWAPNWVIVDYKVIREGGFGAVSEPTGSIVSSSGNASIINVTQREVERLREVRSQLQGKIQGCYPPVCGEIQGQINSLDREIQKLSNYQETAVSSGGNEKISFSYTTSVDCDTYLGIEVCGPGAAINGKVIVYQRYLGDPNSLQQASLSLVEQSQSVINRANQNPSVTPNDPTNSSCVSVDSKQGWQRFNLGGSFTKITRISGGWSVDTRSYAPVGASGHGGRDAEALTPYNQYKYDQRFPFGALLIGSGQGVLWIQSSGSFSSAPFATIDMRINDADNALGDNGGSLQVCFGN